jgi:DNA-binding NarL/FixJ family response regulator
MRSDQPIRTLLVEDQPLTRIGIGTVIAEEEDIELAGESGTAADGFAKFRELRPDVTILGLRLPDSCSLDDLDNYFIADPKAKIIVLAEHAGDAEISRALKKGAAGYICKDVSPEDLLKAIRTVAAGKKYIPADIAPSQRPRQCSTSWAVLPARCARTTARGNDQRRRIGVRASRFPTRPVLPSAGSKQ